MKSGAKGFGEDPLLAKLVFGSIFFVGRPPLFGVWVLKMIQKLTQKVTKTTFLSLLESSCDSKSRLGEGSVSILDPLFDHFFGRPTPKNKDGEGFALSRARAPARTRAPGRRDF